MGDLHDSTAPRNFLLKKHVMQRVRAHITLHCFSDYIVVLRKQWTPQNMQDVSRISKRDIPYLNSEEPNHEHVIICSE